MMRIEDIPIAAFPASLFFFSFQVILLAIPSSYSASRGKESRDFFQNQVTRGGEMKQGLRAEEQGIVAGELRGITPPWRPD